MDELEAIKKLELSAKECVKALGNLEIREKSMRLSMNNAYVKSVELQKQVDELENKKKEITSQIEIEKKSKIDEINKKSDELEKERKELRTQLNINIALEDDLKKRQLKADKAREEYERLVSEYNLKLSEISKKKDALEAILR